jgi:hypothetical protein
MADVRRVARHATGLHRRGRKEQTLSRLSGPARHTTKRAVLFGLRSKTESPVLPTAELDTLTIDMDRSSLTL